MLSVRKIFPVAHTDESQSAKKRRLLTILPDSKIFNFFFNTFIYYINSQEILLDILKHKFSVFDDFEYDHVVVTETLKISDLKDD